jgi:hypothetical protein
MFHHLHAALKAFAAHLAAQRFRISSISGAITIGKN